MRVAPVIFLCLVLPGCASTSAQPTALDPAVQAVQAAAEPIRETPQDYDSLLTLIGDNDFVLLGESTHGTREFYRERARITKRLIEERGFTVVAVEADWQDAFELNEFIHGRGPASADEALRTFTRFPQWMWANTEIAELAEWMRDYNASPAGRRNPVGFCGMDLYGVEDAIDEVIGVLKAEDAAAAARAAQRYKCIEPHARRGMDTYAVTPTAGACADNVAAVFEDLDKRMQRDGRHRPGDERLVSAWQSARVVMNGEAYYRIAGSGGVESWNVRDRHMADTLDALSTHLRDAGPAPAKLVVWAHNSHLGDARVTERAEAGELNVGQLMRQRHDGESVIVGFTTYDGMVRAASSWGSRGEERRLNPARDDSFAAIFHATGIPQFVLRLRGNTDLMAALGRPRLQRFVGVIYAPQTERYSHYFETDLARQYDAVVHIDRTSAVSPVASTTLR
jgi:erythromycin esterase-like protein